MCFQQDLWKPVTQAIFEPSRWRWLRQRLTGASPNFSLINSITEFVMFENPIDIEKLRKSLHHQVDVAPVFDLVSHYTARPY